MTRVYIANHLFVAAILTPTYRHADVIETTRLVVIHYGGPRDVRNVVRLR